MRNGTVLDADAANAAEVSRGLRLCDYNELYAATGRNPMEVVMESFRATPGDCYVFRYRGTGRPVSIFGCGAGSKGTGVPWMVSTPDVKHCAREVIVLGNRYTNMWQNKYPLLVNYVDARNEASMRWLKALGYSFIRLHEHYGAARIPFYEFVRI